MIELKKRVCEANKILKASGIVINTWGNVSEIDETHNFVAIKPSGVNYENMTPEDIVILDLNGNVLEGTLNPSTDTPTHLEIYKNFPQIKGITHTHSIYATAFAQAGIGIKPFGTTHADYFYGEIPITRELTSEEVNTNYELNTGKIIVETIKNPMETPAVLVKNHGVFTFGKNAGESVDIAIILENVSKIAHQTLYLNPNVSEIPEYLLKKHYSRKFGENKYYGQNAL